jgi:hypothetical protein
MLIHLVILSGGANHNTYIHGIKIITMIIIKVLGILALVVVITFIVALLLIIIDDKLN